MCADVLIAEDDDKQAELVRLYLERDGHSVTVVANGRAAVDRALECEPDLLVLDLMLPRLDGLDVLRALRGEARRLPVLMLTARSTEDDMLLGLGLGADDYMTKPYSPRELTARVRTLLRRTSPEPDATDPVGRVLTVGALRVDTRRHDITLDGVPVDCTPAEFRILEAMAAEPDRVFTREGILRKLHGFAPGNFNARSVDMHMSHLRKKIEPVPRKPVRLITVFGVGYRLTDPARGRGALPQPRAGRPDAE
ncbi:response regulator transcription factor [Kitasatospora sp. NPDC101176]|uniref:response regulator transcription factor n=1 Tax=Kitasatospora sp. NPDC101176 TaxID=3364099 RepID=UPI00381A0F04